MKKDYKLLFCSFVGNEIDRINSPFLIDLFISLIALKQSFPNALCIGSMSGNQSGGVDFNYTLAFFHQMYAYAHHEF